MVGISICITAYKAQEFIKQALDSIYTQSWFENHDNWEVVLGIDGCKDTLAYVKEILPSYDEHLRVYMMDSNKGTYITTNTVMKLAKYDTLLRFDADDIFEHNAIKTLMLKYKDWDFVKFTMQNFGMNNSITKSVGVHMIKRFVFEEFGGYQPWSCSADSEFIKRVKQFVKMTVTSELIFYRRVHSESLTRKKGVTQLTGDRGIERKKYLDYVHNMNITDKKNAVIKCITNTYKEVTLDKGQVYDKSAYDNFQIVDTMSMLYPSNIDLSKLKKVIYTVSDNPEEITNKKADYDYICFTNQNIQSDTWEIRSIPDELKNLSKERQKTIIKICPHLYLSEYEFSIYTETPNEIKDIVLANNKSVYMYKSPGVGGIYREANSCIDRKLDKWSTIHNQMMRYSRNLYPVRNGLAKTDTIYRLHNSNYCKRLMNKWRVEVEEGSYIDRLSFNYCLWKVGNKGFAYV